MNDYTFSIDENIAVARSLTGTPRLNKLVNFDSLGDLLTRQSERFPDKEFLIWFDKQNKRFSISYRETLENIRFRAEVLCSMSIKPGDRIGVFIGNYPVTFLTYLACWFFGCTVVPLSVAEDDRHLRFIIDNSQMRLVFTLEELTGRISGILASGEFPMDIPLIIETVNGEILSRIPTRSNDQKVQFDKNPDSEALIVYTSGTTGNPKGVVLDHYNLLVDAMALSAHHRIENNTRMMCVLPLHHVNGTVVTLITPLFAGASVVLNEKFSVHQFFPRLAAEKVEVVSVVPTLLAFLLEANAPVEGLELQLRHIICGAGPLTVDLAMRFEDRYGIPIAHGYGLSETTCYSCCMPIDISRDEHRRWMSAHGYPSIGHAFPINEMAIIDSSGKSLPAGERGEIAIRGHNVMKGYFANDEANRSAFQSGWFKSGDEGFWKPDKNGIPYYFITGRIKELIIRGGVNISPLEIDEVLMTIPGVRAGIAVGFTHDLYGEEVGAYVQLNDSTKLTEVDIIEYCKARLPSAKTPKVVIFGKDMPVTSTGKYQRNKLKNLFSQWKTARFQ